MKTVLVVSLVLMTSLLSMAAAPTPEGSPRAALGCSLTVHSGDCTGSGVAVANREARFVWTNAHVVKPALTILAVIEPETGRRRPLPRFADVWLSREVIEGGRKVGEDRRLAAVIRYSETQDLAVLRPRASHWPTATTLFSGAEPPSAGDACWHVGSMKGIRGAQSLSDGVVAAIGRLRKDGEPSDTEGVIYDQVSLSAGHPGSSGGGVFRRSDGLCLGLVTEFLGPTHTAGSLCITPSRRIRAFAKEARCEWAVDARVPVPEVDGEAILRDPIMEAGE